LKTIASSEWKDSSEGFSIINYQLSIINHQSAINDENFARRRKLCVRHVWPAQR